MSTDHRPNVDQLPTDTSVKYWPTIGEVSAKCRRSVGKVSAKSYIGRDTSGTIIDRVSTECRPTIDQLSTAISTDCRPSVHRVSTDCRPTVDRLSTAISTECRPLYRPLYRPISRSTLPTVNKSRAFLFGAESNLIPVNFGERKSVWQGFQWEICELVSGKLSKCLYTAISRKIVGKSASDNPERHCGWF